MARIFETTTLECMRGGCGWGASGVDLLALTALAGEHVDATDHIVLRRTVGVIRPGEKPPQIVTQRRSALLN